MFFFFFLLVIFVCLLIISSPDCLKNQLYPPTQGCSSGQDCQFCHLCAPGGGGISIVKRHTVDGSEIRQTQPVELGTLSHDFRGFIHPRCLGMGRISSINSRVVNQPLVLLPKVQGISGQHPQCHSQKIRPYVIFKDYWGNNDGLQIPGYQGRLFLGPLDSFFAKGL